MHILYSLVRAEAACLRSSIKKPFHTECQFTSTKNHRLTFLGSLICRLET